MLSNSLSSRIYGVGIAALLTIVAVVLLLSEAADRTKNAFIWVRHTEEVIRTVDELIVDVREAESGQRGFLLTKSSVYLDTFNERVADAEEHAARLARLVADNPDQVDRALRLQHDIGEKIDTMRRPVAMAEKGSFEDAIAFVASGKGRLLMQAVAMRADEMRSAEKSLLLVRSRDAEQEVEWNRTILLIGCPFAALLLLALMYLLVRSIRKPLDGVLSSMTAFGEGDLTARAHTATGMHEFDKLGRVYNQMADRLAAALEQLRLGDEELQMANGELRAQGLALQARGHAIETLGGMAHRMQAARSDTELGDVLRCFLPQVLPNIPGALYVHDESRTRLIRLVEWGNIASSESFSPDDCWALRRGHGHVLEAPGSDVVCAHLHDHGTAYQCEPVLAGGEVIGLLHLDRAVGAEEGFRLRVLLENIALALANHQLQRGLREQSIRDPLTNLFNRRYMEEALDTEMARAARSKSTIAMVMCDVDHFKRFNDNFGHDAGDALLRAVAEQINVHFRNGDIACRFGGEEFAIIAPGADIHHLARRAERLGEAIRQLEIRHHGVMLDPVTMSFGVASISDSLDRTRLIRSADEALYRAKAGGRDRVVLAGQAAIEVLAAAE